VKVNVLLRDDSASTRLVVTPARGRQPRQVILRAMDSVKNEDLVKAWSKKMAPPLVTLLSSEPEVRLCLLKGRGKLVCHALVPGSASHRP
jgi:outer membrane cobalamin receptor